ncbi:MAG: hypothetical protein M5U31_02250 [Acidimicrobiia bacterium]|nr:hypothetical protein [Acidimicrobiia bacterium]
MDLAKRRSTPARVTRFSVDVDGDLDVDERLPAQAPRPPERWVVDVDAPREPVGSGGHRVVADRVEVHTLTANVGMEGDRLLDLEFLVGVEVEIHE